MAEFNQRRQQKAIEDWTELHRRVSVGAYSERSAENFLNGTYPPDGVEESIDNLTELAARHGLEFIWTNNEWSLGPMSEETRAARQAAQEYQVRQGECVECKRFSSQLTENGYCEGCVMQAAIDAMES
jgi:hypothetical protein